MDLFAAIYFRGPQNLTMLEQCRVCPYGHFRGDFFSRENKLIYSSFTLLLVLTVGSASSQEFMGSIPGSGECSYIEARHEIFSTTICSLPLI